MKKIVLAALSTVLAFSLVSCGNSKQEEVDADSASGQKEFVYVPEYISLGDEENTYYSDIRIAGNSLYYTVFHFDEETQTQENKFMEYSLETNESRELPVKISEGRSINSFTVDAEGNIYTAEYRWGEPDAEGMAEDSQFLCKYDSQGNVVYEQDITQIMESDENNSWIGNIAVDDQGRLYMTSDSLIRLFDAEGNMQGEVSQVNGWIQGLGKGKDGKIYLSYYDINSATGGVVLTEIDFDGKKLGTTSYGNFPNGNSNGGLAPGVEKDFMVSDGSRVYEYDLATQSAEELFAWLDSDITGTYVEYVGAVENGRLIAIIRDWNTNKTEIAYLTKTAASELPEKKQLTIGTLYESQALQAAAVEFNKNSDTYHVNIKNYIDTNNWTETSFEDGITALNNDILSSSNCPDILDLSQLNIEQLASKDVLADLSPYLEKSSVFSKDDFLESIINAYTIDGKLISIPNTFNLSTIVARTSDVGEEMGWTLEEMMAYAEEHPDAALFDGFTKSTAMYILAEFNLSAFVDWESGECSFDSEEFKALLEFINAFPDEYDWEADGASTASKLQSGEVLLYPTGIYEINSIQEYEAMFNEPVTFIGYPNADGTSGCYIMGNEMYAISTKSENKEGAWEFIESYLKNAPDSMFSWGLYSNKQFLEDLIERETTVEYILDENGDPVLDENGEPMTASGTHSISIDDWEYTYHVPTEEEVAKLWELIENAVPTYSSDPEINRIIEEEAEAYFQGQKTVDDVAGIIQSRVQVYVNENR